ncbi:WD40 repeat domain-containing protein, partial [Candidatus Poribacteria bacterium]|nr:WD40 repeat domain-containing protein [Candidatus Poribacteria bacterium]
MQKFKKYMLSSKFWCVIVFCTSLFTCNQSYFCQTAKADSYASTRYLDVTYSPDRNRLAAATSQGIWLYDAQTYQRRLVLRGSAGIDYYPEIVLFSPDGKMLAVGGRGTKEIQLFRPSDGELILSLKGSQDETSCIAFSPDSKTLASGNDDKTILLWDIDTGNLLKTLKGHTDKVSSVAFSPDGKTLASASYDKTIRLWNARTGEFRKMLKGHKDKVYSVA